MLVFAGGQTIKHNHYRNLALNGRTASNHEGRGPDVGAAVVNSSYAICEVSFPAPQERSPGISAVAISVATYSAKAFSAAAFLHNRATSQSRRS